eukprot:COSAG01_NODE_10874_length_2064_cov_2.511450_2_plen_172_part_01
MACVAGLAGVDRIRSASNVARGHQWSGVGGGGGWRRRVLEELERQQHLDRVWAKVDADGNGWLDRGELEAVPAATASPIHYYAERHLSGVVLTGPGLWPTPRAFRSRNNGAVRCVQVLRLMGRTDAEIDMDATMAELDADGDEEISKEEFAPVIVNARCVWWLGWPWWLSLC